jgi:nucleotide-binding universal stress UspA family protein
VRRVILGFDGRPASRAALAWVAHRAAQAREPLRATIVPTGDDEHRRADLEAAADALRAVGVTTRISTGAQHDDLIRPPETDDMVVLGVPARAHPHPSTGEAVRRIMRYAPAPSCFIPAGWVPGAGPVTVGVDADDSSDIAVYFAAREAAQTARTLRLVHCLTPPDARSPASGGTPGAQPSSRARMDAAVREARLAAEGVPIEVDLRRTDPTAALSSEAADSSMIVIGTHRGGVLGSGAFGSVGQHLIGRVDCPVCVVPPAR